MKNDFKIKIFYADDDEDDRFLFKTAVSELKIPVELSCFSSCNQLEKALAEQNYICDFVFLDLNMPGKSGLETLNTLQHVIKNNQLKVIIYTTSAARKVIKQTYDQNAVLFVQKPVDFKSILNALEQIITRRLPLQFPISFKNFQYKFI